LRTCRWLVGTLVVLNGIDWVAFEILNIGNPSTDSIPTHFRVLDGLFQAFAVRSGGFYVVNISKLRPGLLCLYISMMYLSALPVTLTLRNTNIYEERSLGIFAEEIAKEPKLPSPFPSSLPTKSQDSTSANVVSTIKRRLTGQTNPNNPQPATTTTWSRRDFLRQQFHGQLSHDLWWIALAIFLITIIETSQFERDPIHFSVFNIIFECVSAYGCVGISVGVPWQSYSFSGAWHVGSKLVLCAVMLRGRHRGLPVAVDRAVLVPDETLGWAEEEDAVVRARSRSVGNQGDV
jgi:Trk-type K+ transport system membrane component